MADAADLAGLQLFEDLNADQLVELAGWFDVRTVGPGIELVSEGASGYSFFVLLEGGAVVTTAGRPSVAVCVPGDFFGEIAILGDSRRTATVTTTRPSRLLVLFGTDFRRLQEAHPAVAARLEEAVAQRRAADAA
jgi:voltage-gated potassium channel